MEKSQDIRNLLESSNMSINDESSFNEKPFFLSEEMNKSGQFPSTYSPNNQDGFQKGVKFSIRGLDPYIEKNTHKNDLKVVNQLN